MYKFYHKLYGKPSGYALKLLMIMRLIILLMVTTILHVSAASYAQRITLHQKDANLEDVFMQIRAQSGYDIFFNQMHLRNTKPVTIAVTKVTVTEALDLALANQPFSYEIKDKTIIVTRKEDSFLSKVIRNFATIDFRAKITDSLGKPLPGAIVKIKSTGKVLTTNAQGEIFIQGLDKGEEIIISYLGYKSRNYKITEVSKDLVLISLEQEVSALKDVSIVVNGIFSRKKESFTGAVASFTGAELKAVGNQNIIQSLKSLDPSFIQIENNSAGSNPNTLASIELRGRTSVSASATTTLTDEFTTDPNQPLFILDGFETTLRVITDLDINRVESITLLKDAASASIYGARAANGVVVIETKKPKPGTLQVYYSSDLRIELPDLSGYNMMNSSEKLEFERLSGRYTRPLYDPAALDILYNQRLAEIKRGVDTYWLTEPLRTGFTQGHSLSAGGGAFSYNITGNYKNTTGTMKGSDRDTWGGTVDLIYRTSKLNIRNNLFVNGYSSNESPYGSFSTWVNANPFFRKTNADGTIDKYFEQGLSQFSLPYSIPNPLYGVHLNKYNKANNLGLRNNLQAVYSLNNTMQLQAGVQISQNNVTSTSFLPSDDASFDGVDIFKKGSYANNRTEAFQYVANVMMNYGNTFAGGHSLTANVRAEIQENSAKYIGLVATGFPAGVEGNPAFAYSYQQNSKPSSSSQLSRSNSLLGALNYAYKSRYLADFSYRLDGSTVFGSTKRYSPFWSAGTGWNIHNESFLKDINWISLLKLRASIGMTGNQNFLSTTSATIYQYESILNRFGLASNVLSVGNKNLEWQNTKTLNGGLDLAFLKNRISATFNVYHKITDPLVIDVGVPTSIGTSTVKLNTGKLINNGIEANIRYAVIFKPENTVIWTLGLTASNFTSTYEGFNNTLNSLNATQQTSGSLIRFKDGYSPYDIWALQSLGIDPATGKEVFLKKNGQSTFIYDAADIVSLASTKPRAEGVLSSNLRLKAFTFAAYFRYRFGGSAFNTALYNKVENISNTALINNNQDRRALYERWQKAGDIAQFKSITDLSYTPASSRFIQKDNTLTGESISLGYELGQYKWIKNTGLKSLRVTGYMNDWFYLSTIKRERGIDYPFANSVSFSLNASF